MEECFGKLKSHIDNLQNDNLFLKKQNETLTHEVNVLKDKVGVSTMIKVQNENHSLITENKLLLKKITFLQNELQNQKSFIMSNLNDICNNTIINYHEKEKEIINEKHQDLIENVKKENDNDIEIDGNDIEKDDNNLENDNDIKKDGNYIENDNDIEKDDNNLENDNDIKKDGNNIEKDGNDIEKDGNNIEKDDDVKNDQEDDDDQDVDKDGNNIEKDDDQDDKKNESHQNNNDDENNVDDDDDEFFEFVYKKKTYFVNEQTNRVYEKLDDNDIGREIGSLIKMKNGKNKVEFN